MILLDNTALSAFAHIDRLDLPSKLFGETIIPESVYYEGVVKARKSERVDRILKCIEKGVIKVIKPKKAEIEAANNLVNKDELGQLVEMLREILFFTDDLEKWVLSNDLS